jgi:hypothetical protein
LLLAGLGTITYIGGLAKEVPYGRKHLRSQIVVKSQLIASFSEKHSDPMHDAQPHMVLLNLI